MAEIDKTPLEGIECIPNTDPLCVESYWSYWSDGVFTKKTFAPHDRPDPEACPISKDARGLITALTGSDTGHVDGGIRSLITIDKILSQKEEIIGRKGYYAADRIEIMEVKHKDGSKETLYARTEGYPEGYAYDIYRSRKDALQVDMEDFYW